MQSIIKVFGVPTLLNEEETNKRMNEPLTMQELGMLASFVAKVVVIGLLIMFVLAMLLWAFVTIVGK